MTGVDLERTCILDDYSAQLARRDKALDTRESLIDRREKELQVSKQTISEQLREVESLKASLYAERAGFATQRSALVNDRKEIDSKASVIRHLIKTSKNTSLELDSKKHELRKCNENLAQMYAALKAAQESMDGLRKRENRTVERESKCTDIVIALDNRQKELDTLQNELHRLQNALSKREASVAHAIQVIPLKDCLPELKQVAREYAEFRARRADNTGQGDINMGMGETSNDPKEHARKLKDFFNDIRTFARSLEAREAATIRREDALNSREKSHAEAAELLAAREKTVAEKFREVESAQRKLDSDSHASKEMWEKSSENLRKITAMEEQLETRERACRDEEVRLADKLKNIERQVALINAQEKSIKRTGASLKGFEEALRRDARKVKEEKSEIARIEGDVEAREKLLKTKTMEIEVREARLKRVDIFHSVSNTTNINDANDSRALNADKGDTRNRHRSRNKSRVNGNDNGNRASSKTMQADGRNSEASSSGSGSTAGNDQLGSDRANSDAAIDINIDDSVNINAVDVGSTKGGRNARISDTSDAAAEKSLPSQRTVRKQLTFGRTPNVNVNVNESTSTSSSSEQAAEQLHGELRAARAVWIEKVNRLDSVVASMSQDLTSTGTQLLPVIETVRSELHRIRDEASSQNEQNNNTGGSGNKFTEEQARHRHWAHVMTTQLNTIKQVQTGLLHAFNRVLPPPNEQEHEQYSAQTANTPVYQPSSLPREPLQPRQTQAQEGRGRNVNNTNNNSNTTRKNRAANRANSRESTNGSEEHQTLEKLLSVIDASNNRNRTQNKPQSNSISVYSNQAATPQLPKYRMAPPLRGAWADIDRVANITRTPRTTSEELAALRRELGLDN